MGTVHLSLEGSAARTVFPDKIAEFTYNVTCTAASQATINDVLTDGGVRLTLKAGISWTIQIDAMFNNSPVGRVIINNVRLTEGEIRKINDVFMLPITGGAQGRLVYNMAFPSDVASALLTYSAADGVPIDSVNLKSGGSGNIPLAPGFYLVSAVLEKNNKKAGSTEVVHIYPGQDTSIKWQFSDNAFLAAIDVPVTVTVSHSSGIVIDSMELRSDNYSIVSEYTVTAPGTYLFMIPEVESSATKVDGVYLIITTSNNTLATTTRSYAIAAGGFSLDPVAIYALNFFNNHGGRTKAIFNNFSVDKNGDFQLDLFAGTGLEVTASPNPGYNLISFTASANISNPPVNNKFTFAMPASDATITAVFEAISGLLSRLSADDTSGEFEITGIVDGKAQAGADITVTAKPKPGYKLVNGAPISTPAFDFTTTGAFTWEFKMPGEDTVLKFAELTTLEIYKGGAQKGISNIVVADCDYYGASWKNNVELNADVEGRNGNPRAIRVFRPAAGQDNGLEGAENNDRADIGFALTSTGQLPLRANNVTALSLWIKAPRANMTMEFLGFGEGTNAMGIGNAAIDTANTWKRFIIPVPAAENEKTITRKLFAKFNGLNQGEQVLIDDIEFITTGTPSTVVSNTITIPNSYPYKLNFEPVNLITILPANQVNVSSSVTYTVDGSTAVIRNAGWGAIAVNLSNWGFAPPAALEYIVDGADYNAANGMITPISLDSTFTVQARMGTVYSNKMTCTVVAVVFTGLIIENHSDTNVGNWLGDHTNNDRKYWVTGMGTDPYIDPDTGSAGVVAGGFSAVSGDSAGNSKSVFYTPKISGAKGGRHFVSGAKNLSGYTTLSFWFKRQNSGDTYVIALYNGSTWTGANAETGTGTRFSAEFTPNAALNTFEKITVNLSDFKDAGGNAVNRNAVTGWAIIVKTKTTTNNPDTTGRIWIETILVE